MKKLLLSAITALALVSSAFEVEFKVDADLSCHTETLIASYQNEIATFSSFPIGLSVGVDAYFTDLIGASFKANLGFTNSLNYKDYIDGQVNNDVIYDFNSANTKSFFLGMAIRPKNEKFFFVTTPGAILSFSAFKANGKININAFGLGVDLQAGYKITDKIAINAGALTAILFSPKIRGNGTLLYPEYVKTVGFIIEPKVGVSIFF